MKANQTGHNLKTFTLSLDEPHLSSVRRDIVVTYKAGDQMIISPTDKLSPGSLVLVSFQDSIRFCRYERIHENDYLFPPLGIDPSKYNEVILGQVIDHVRIGKWPSKEE